MEGVELHKQKSRVVLNVCHQTVNSLMFLISSKSITRAVIKLQLWKYLENFSCGNPLTIFQVSNCLLELICGKAKVLSYDPAASIKLHNISKKLAWTNIEQRKSEC